MTTATAAQVHVLTPGTHADGQEQTVAAFLAETFAAIDGPALFLRSGKVGQLVGEPGSRHFEAITRDQMRIFVEQFIYPYRIVKIPKQSRKQEPGTQPIYSSLTPDHGALLLAAAREHAYRLDSISPFPQLLNTAAFSPPGLTDGHFYDEPDALKDILIEAAALTVERACENLNNLLVDFPFQDRAADFQNYLGLLLTPLVRPSIRGPVPMHLISAPRHGVGKSLLVSQVLGITVTGEPLSTLQLGDNESEAEKRISTSVYEMCPILNLDNVPADLDSPALAMLLTSDIYHGRMLGKTQSIRVPNRCMVVATGNNIGASGEITRRTVPIRLVQTQERQEKRTGFEHPNLTEFLTLTRTRHLASLYRLILEWLASGRPLSTKPLGSFESWSSIVGGVLENVFYVHHLGNRDEWAEAADQEHTEWAAMVKVWSELPIAHRTATELAEVAKAAGLFERIWGYAKSDRAAVTSFGRNLFKACGRMFNGHFIRYKQSGNGKTYYLEGSGGSA